MQAGLACTYLYVCSQFMLEHSVGARNGFLFVHVNKYIHMYISMCSYAYIVKYVCTYMIHIEMLIDMQNKTKRTKKYF